jgi:large subunit ribosomal protein L25
MNLRIEAQPRKQGKKSDIGALRKQGKVPGVIYGAGTDNVLITIDQKELTRVLKQAVGHMSLFDLVIEGKEYKTVIKERQIHPVGRQIIHIDFMELNADREMNLEIPVILHGDPIGVKKGGLVELHVHKLPVSCLPKDIQDDLKIDVTNLEVGQGVHVRDLDLGAMQARLAPETTIVMVHAPKVIKETAATTTTAEVVEKE